MKYLIAVAFLAVIVPAGQEKGTQPKPNQDVTQERKQGPSQTAAPTVNAINQPAANKEENSAKGHPESYLHRLLAPENLPNIGLFFAGVIGIWIANRTLSAIESQTNVLSESQRPRIVAEAGDGPSKTFADESARRVKLKVTNKGMMPAIEYRYESWIEILPDTSGDFTRYADHFPCETVSVLCPNTPQFVNIPSGRKLLETTSLRSKDSKDTSAFASMLNTMTPSFMAGAVTPISDSI
jgi:hypothetical protein